MTTSRLAYYSNLVLITTYLSFITVVAPGRDFTLNVALNKSVICYPEDSSSAANRAVDGDDGTTAYTSNSGCSNCSVVVNLGERVYVRKLRVVTDRTGNFTVLTSNSDSPERPSFLSNDWTIRYFAILSNSVYSITVSLYLDELSSHVAVYTEYDDGRFGVSEVELYSYDVSDKPPNLVSSTSEVDSSSVYSDDSPSRALDQNIDMFDENTYFSSEGGSNPHWWTVKLDTPVVSQCVVSVYPYLRKKRAYSSEFSRLDGTDVMLSKEDEPGAPLMDNSKWVQCVPNSKVLFHYILNGPIITTCQETPVKYMGLYKDYPESLEIGEVRVYETDCSSAEMHCDAWRIHNDDVKASCYSTGGYVITYKLVCYNDQHVLNDASNQLSAFQWSRNNIFVSCNSSSTPIIWNYTDSPGTVAMGIIQPDQILGCTQADTSNRPTISKPDSELPTTNCGTRKACTGNGMSIMMLIIACVEIASTFSLT